MLQCSGRHGKRAENVGSNGKSGLELVGGCGEGAESFAGNAERESD
jgi:hypothetical protein